MTKTRVFISFDFDHDHSKKEDLISQAGRKDSPFSVTDFSLKEEYPDDKWLARAQSAIARCDLFIVVLGENTHNAPGVRKEVNIAKGLRIPRFQLRPRGRTYGMVRNGGPMVIWRWPNLKRAIAGQRTRFDL